MPTYAAISIVGLLLVACILLWGLFKQTLEIHEILTTIHDDLNPLVEEASKRERDRNEAENEWLDAAYPTDRKQADPTPPIPEPGWTMSDTVFAEALAKVGMDTLTKLGHDAKLVPDPADPTRYWVTYKPKVKTSEPPIPNKPLDDSQGQA